MSITVPDNLLHAVEEAGDRRPGGLTEARRHGGQRTEDRRGRFVFALCLCGSVRELSVSAGIGKFIDMPVQNYKWTASFERAN